MKDSPSYSENDLVDGIISRNGKAWKDTYNYLIAFSHKLIKGSYTDDFYHDFVIEEILKTVERIESGEYKRQNLIGFLITRLKFAYFNKLKESRNYAEMEKVELTVGEIVDLERMEILRSRDRELDLLDSIVSSLKQDKCKKLLNYFHVEGLSHKEIVNLKEFPEIKNEATCRQQCHRCREAWLKVFKTSPKR